MAICSVVVFGEIHVGKSVDDPLPVPGVCLVLNHIFPEHSLRGNGSLAPRGSSIGVSSQHLCRNTLPVLHGVGLGPCQTWVNHRMEWGCVIFLHHLIGFVCFLSMWFFPLLILPESPSHQPQQHFINTNIISPATALLHQQHKEAMQSISDNTHLTSSVYHISDGITSDNATNIGGPSSLSIQPRGPRRCS